MDDLQAQKIAASRRLLEWNHKLRSPTGTYASPHASQIENNFLVPKGTFVHVRRSGTYSWSGYTTRTENIFGYAKPNRSGDHWKFEKDGWQMTVKMQYVKILTANQQ